MIFSIQYLSYIYLQPIEIFLPINVTFAKRTPAPMLEPIEYFLKNEVFLFEKVSLERNANHNQNLEVSDLNHQ